jgi:glycosyltransferase involved in cell wall biosynthesis
MMSCLPETVGDAGLLVDPRKPDEVASAIKRVVETPELRRDLHEGSLHRARNFSWEKTAKLTLAVYGELAGSLPSGLFGAS